MKENKVYACIVYTLYNIFCNDEIKSQIIVNKELKQLITKQICNLLTLEKEFDANLNNNKFTISFAQALANITKKSEIIEKVDNFTLKMIDDEYIFFVQYIVNFFKIEKNYIIRENNITNELIDETSYFVNKKTIDNINKKEKQNEQKIDEDKSKLKTTGINWMDTLMKRIGAGFNDSNKFDMFKIMREMKNMPVHPRLDPRFYFYKSKPKYMPVLKKVIAIFIILASFLLVLLWFLNSYLNIYLNVKVITYTIPETNQPVIVGGGADVILHNNNNNFSEIFIFGSKFQFLLTQSASLQTFSGILSILPGVFLGYELLGKKIFKRDNYVVKFWPIILSIVIFFYSSLSLIQVLLPNTVEESFYNISISNNGFFIKNDQKLLLTGNLLLPDSDLNITIKNLANEVYKSLNYKILLIFTIISMITGIFASIISFILGILAPKIDRNKLIYANTEYQKAVEAIMNGKNYEMDPLLFDDEFKDNNNFKKNNSDNLKDKKNN